MPSVLDRVRSDGFTMTNVSWTSYTTLADEFDSGRVRVTYDNGYFELMTTSSQHEGVKKLAARLLEYWATERDWPVTGYGHTTLRREDLLVGLEPDECYYVRPDPPPMMPGVFDLHAYPPPDLAIEVEVSRSAVDKVSIYGRLGVPEVWRWTGERFLVLVRQSDGTYAEQAASVCLPALPMDALSDLTRLGIEKGHLAAVGALRDRLRSA